MKRLLLACAATAALTTGAWAETVGVTMANSDTFLSVLRNGIISYAKEKGVTLSSR